MLWKTLILAAAGLSLALPVTEGVVMCYYESWAVYRFGAGQVKPEDLDNSVCTHYHYAYAGIDSYYRIRVLDPWADLCSIDGGGLCGFDKFTGMKSINPYIKTLLSVGGWNEGSIIYSEMASTSVTRATFIQSSITLLKKHNFDGLDLCWTYPTQNGGSIHDKENLVLLLQEMKAAMAEYGMMVTLSAPPNQEIVGVGYDIPGIAKEVDFVSVTTFNFHGAWESHTHHHSGLYAFVNDTGYALTLNVDAAISYWLDNGMPAGKLVMGVPTYGRCWTLNTEAEHGYYAPAYLAGAAGPWTQEAGFMAYGEICKKQQDDNWEVDMEVGCNEPYTYHMPSNRIWCSYEDQESVIIKAKYAAEKRLLGVYVWSINDDDSKGICNTRKYDITHTLSEAFIAASRK